MKTKVQWRRRIVLLIIAALVVAGLLYGFRPQPVEVDIATVSRGPLRVAIEQEGRTRVVDRYVVTAPVGGYARRIRFDVGSSIERGATVVELEPQRAEVLDVRRRAEAQARIAGASASIDASKQRASAAASGASLAQSELQRIRSLRTSGYATAADAERAATEAARSAAESRSAQFAVAIARHELEAARTALQYAAGAVRGAPIAVTAPVAGQIFKIPRKSEGPVALGQPLLEIGDPHALEVEVDLLSADAVRIRPGTRVLFERWGGDTPLRGVVRLIEPAGFTKVSALGVEEQRVWVIVAFASPADQWQRLGDAYRVEANFIVWEADDVLQIPASALFRDGSGWAAFVVEQDKAARRRVRIGQSNGLATQVLDGIDAGQKVIVHPDERVRDGVRVAVR
ncbi:MAG: HlyD family efflux transporter periplasmic adaptor subunit [Telluria sp.]|nr:HlyD family efflux transporter periplasmic adaptor subunit [Telluria sp.]